MNYKIILERFNNSFFPNDNRGGHFKSLDGLRGIAVLLVLLSHSSNERIFFHEFFNFSASGKVGVYLFFVLSAYLLDRQIALSLINKKASNKYWKNYFLRRFLRIYPLFIISLILYLFFSLLGIPTVIDKVADIPKHLLLARGESIFWSIPVEFKYYFFSPLIMWGFSRYFKWDIKYLIIFFTGAISLSFILELIFRFSSISTIRYLPIFLLGTAVAIIELFYNERIKGSGKKYIYDGVGLLSFIVILITTPYYFESLFGFTINFHSPVFYIPYALLWAGILISAKYGNGIIKRFLELKFLRFLGVISYSAYLFHLIFLKLIIRSDIAAGLKIYVFFLLTILFSSVSFLLIERPLSKIRLSSRSTKQVFN